MPIDFVQHRVVIGVFLLSFIKFMCARAKKAAENFRRTLKVPFSVRFSDFVLVFLTVSMLLRCGDIESNPGPYDGFAQGVDSISNQMQILMATVSNIGRQNERTQKQLTENHQDVRANMHEIRRSLEWVTKSVCQNTENIRQLESRLSQSENRVLRMEDLFERLQSDQRRNNVKLTGLEEETKETHVSLINSVVVTVGTYCTVSEIRTEDVIDAVRVGRRREAVPRPVIVTFRSRDVAMSVLRDRDGRYNMSADAGVRVGPDLTPSQRDEMDRLRQEGKRGFLRNGRVVPVHTPDQRYPPGQRWGNRRPVGNRDSDTLRQDAQTSHSGDDTYSRNSQDRGVRVPSPPPPSTHPQLPPSSHQASVAQAASPLVTLPPPPSQQSSGFEPCPSPSSHPITYHTPPLESSGTGGNSGKCDDWFPSQSCSGPPVRGGDSQQHHDDRAEASASIGSQSHSGARITAGSSFESRQQGLLFDAPVSPLRGFGRGSPLCTPPGATSFHPASSRGSSGRGRARVHSSRSSEGEQHASPRLTRSRAQLANATDHRPGGLNKEWRAIFNRENEPSAVGSSCVNRGADVNS
jgi:hypothetical protein